MKKFLYAAVAAFSIFSFASCSSSSDKASETNDSTAVKTVSVDELYANPEAYVNKQVTVEGVCSHLCAHGGRKAFILGSSDTILLRCEALPAMGGAFAQETKHKPLQVNGIFREERIDEAAVQSMEQQHSIQVATINDEQGAEAAEAADNAAGGCDTERAARGQKDIDSFKARMADYRARIAARNEKEGKPYLSFYYLDADSYSILDK